MVFGRTYSKTIVLQGDLYTRAGPVPVQFVSPAPPPPKVLSTVITKKGDLYTRAGPLASQFVSPAPPPPKVLSTVITKIGDPTAAPIVTATTTPAPVVTQSEQLGQIKAFVLTATGDMSVPPAEVTNTIVSFTASAPVKGLAILASASAEFYTVGALISQPLVPIARALKSVIIRGADDTTVIPSTTTATPVIVNLIETVPQKTYVNVSKAVYDTSNLYTTKPSITTFTTPPLKAFVFIKREYTPAGGAPPESPGAGLPNFVVGITRTTSVVAGVLRSTLAMVGLRTSAAAGGTRTTFDRMDSIRTSRTSGTTRTTSDIVNERTTEAS